jgi:2-keto-4-pentenoate hydratase/2-oxohepta-3-ene-1,7-dioic acid hydratase in catechol pathway
MPAALTAIALSEVQIIAPLPKPRSNTNVRCLVNGELRQNANTSDLIFNIPTLIETLSAGITLYPGDIIATGTPVGVGIGFKPPKYLVAGDVVRVEIDGIGAISNPVR